MNAGLADASSGIDDVGFKLGKANEEIESVWIKVEQVRYNCNEKTQKRVDFQAEENGGWGLSVKVEHFNIAAKCL